MQVKLNTDFRDFYDYHFCSRHDPPNQVFDRMSQTGMRKRDQLDLLDHIGLDTPMHGLVRDWVPDTHGDSAAPVVVYTDEFAHAGAGKILTTAADACRLHTDRYATNWVETTTQYNAAESYRLLQIGRRAWWLKYRAEGSWQSNHGLDLHVQVLHEAIGFWEEGERERLPLAQCPLFAIDFVVPLGKNHKLAIDFNTAPGIKNTGLDDILPAKEIYELIVEWMLLYPQTIRCPSHQQQRPDDLRPDRWEIRGSDRVCSYCGSWHPVEFLQFLKECADPERPVYFDHSTKSYKIYVHRPHVPNASAGAIKFYKWHLPEHLSDDTHVLYREAQEVSFRKMMHRSDQACLDMGIGSQDDRS